MTRPVFRRLGGGSAKAAPTAAPSNVARFDPDRRAVEAAKRDPRAFDALYRRYLAQIYSFAAYELGNHHEAEDVTERTFLLALDALPRFEDRAAAASSDDADGASSFRVWLFQIARNAIANHRRARRRHPETPLEAALFVRDPEDFEGRIERRDESARVWAAITRLASDRRRAIVLRFVDELSTAEIAAVMGRSEGAVRVLLHRALTSVARDLGEGRRTSPRDGTR